ncbi:hypothetical protein EDD17DRAFT_1535125 [Pisolithus thermaeus]|nr:hypothetical protein EV401DRAFT_1908876 [Pisolithus croceorrhizus]KAI6167804.1 hypothetical protein EDD17DRAFT_1535125 [Pisolithus thermaeus]
MKMREKNSEEVRRRCDYQNIIESYGQAVEDGYKWMRIDTYCIDKKSSAEPPEVINSMHRRHHNSIICRLYPRDVKGPALRTEQGSIGRSGESNGSSERLS